MTDPYSELVRRHFANPVHAMAPPDGYDDAVTVSASESESGVRVTLAALLDGDDICYLRYRIFGCPHLIAAAEDFCTAMEGKPVSALLELNVPILMDKLDIPVEKTGRLFILEDAARELHIVATGSTPSED